MAVKHGQIRYIADNDDRNYPADLTAAHLTSGAMFDPSIRIKDLSISSGILGLKFYINNTPAPLSTRDSGVSFLSAGEPVKTWSLNTDAIANMPIYSLRFDAESIDRLIEYNKPRLASNSMNGSPYYLFINYTYTV